MTKEIITKIEEDAFNHWIYHFRDQQVDAQIEKFQHLDSSPPLLRLLRESHFLTRAEVAKRLGISQQALAKIESSENKGTITLNTLRKVASALDCEFIFGFRTKSRQSISKQIWNRSLVIARQLPFYRSLVSNNLKDRNTHIRLASHMRTLIEDYDMREKMNWNTRGPTSAHGSFRYIDREWSRWQGLARIKP